MRAHSERAIRDLGARVFAFLPLSPHVEDVSRDVLQLAPPGVASGAVAPFQHGVHRPHAEVDVWARLPTAASW